MYLIYSRRYNFVKNRFVRSFVMGSNQVFDLTIFYVLLTEFFIMRLM